MKNRRKSLIMRLERGWERNSFLSYSGMGGQQMRCANYVRCSYRELMVDSIRGKENKKCWCMPAAVENLLFRWLRAFLSKKCHCYVLLIVH